VYASGALTFNVEEMSRDEWKVLPLPREVYCAPLELVSTEQFTAEAYSESFSGPMRGKCASSLRIPSMPCGI
jgi:hypothetical protein